MDIKRKRGFSMDIYTRKNEYENYTVYFERKGKVTFCYIEDSFVRRTFKGKSVKHETDENSEAIGMSVAFHKALIKRGDFYSKFAKRCTDTITKIKQHEDRLTYKNSKFIQRLK